MVIDRTDLQPGVLDAAHPSGVSVEGCDVAVMFNGANEADRRSNLATLIQWASPYWPTPVAPTLRPVVTIALTADGLRRLGVDVGLLTALPEEFTDVIAARRALLNDPQPSGVGAFAGDVAIDAFIMFSSPEPVALPALPDVCAALGTIATSVADDHREHFGFVDGISNPTLTGSGSTVVSGAGVQERDYAGTRSEWRHLQAGEIIGGYANELGALPGQVIVHDLIRNGSFLVWRVIRQHVEEFQTLAESLAGNGATADQIAAQKERLMGSRLERTVENDFDYVRSGLDVARQSHVRRSRPRSTPGFEDPRAAGVLSERITKPRFSYGAFHRMIRRSILWKDDDGTVGTLFRCYQMSIADQFEFVQRNWLNDGDAFRQGRTRDPIASTGSPDWPGSPPDPRASEADVILNDDETAATGVPLAALTTVLGTRYALVPGRAALRRLAEGDFSP
jgi:deferrochelatase/peroxidase EfeB